MPTPGLSLVGFMDDPQVAINHLRNACVPDDPSDAALIAQWAAARATLGVPITNAGNPDIQPIPEDQQHYIQQLLQLPAFQDPPLQGAAIQLVEIDPLLAYQFTVDTDRSAHHCGVLANPPSLTELLPLCLPLQSVTEDVKAFRGPQSVIMKAKGLNLRTLAQGVIKAAFMGVQFGTALPFLHVVRHNGRCYLHNGFHRAFGARRAGATHVPCVFRDVPDHAAVGIGQGGPTFSAALLESANPPTIAHFTQGRAHPVRIRAVSRVLHVSWAEYVLPDE